ncbi:hypothetical protein [Mycolicibacterium septicum]|uniref:hypothetical protein n=1 Tax=Mycolicibacterium septicum TaxID=98668 RepID=UPI001AF1CB0C|nr:hypothetical protein [Mycolicibacterium septicum]QRY51759.1 hypothetical protein JVX95_31035 [Mycolicibacterium septicum]
MKMIVGAAGIALLAFAPQASAEPFDLEKPVCHALAAGWSVDEVAAELDSKFDELEKATGDTRSVAQWRDYVKLVNCP